MSSNIEIKKEILYRSIHRGCKETDHLIGGFAESQIDDLSDSDLMLMRDFILEDDLLIYDWIMQRVECLEKYQDIVSMIRDFHKM